MIKQRSCLLTAFGLLAALRGVAAAPTVPAADRMFMAKAAQGGNGEVALGRLASKRGSRPAVREFGRRMVTDHSRANAELMRVAARQNVALPRSIAPEDRPLRARLSRLSGPAFDRAYATAMVEDHRQDVKDFRKEARTGRDRAAVRFAAKTLPTLHMHLRMAEQIAGSERVK